jgi:hypothetical protein
LKGRKHFGDFVLDEKIMLKCSSEKQDVGIYELHKRRIIFD